MACPFLRELSAYACGAFPIRKLIPRSDLHAVGPCVARHETCAVFRSHAQRRVETIFADAHARGVVEMRVPAEPPPCVWASEEVLWFRLCHRDLDCEGCPIELALGGRSDRHMESDPARRLAAAAAAPDVAPTRRCKYVVVGEPKRRACERDYRCSECDTFLRIRNAVTAGPTDDAARKEEAYG